MLYCSHCADHSPTFKDPGTGYICCAICARVLDDNVYDNDPTFIKGSDGQSRLAGVFMNSMQRGYSVSSHERTLQKGKDEIYRIITLLKIEDGETIESDLVRKAHRFYQIAVDRNFTKGRLTSHVAASCVYMACRADENPRPYLLIDFSDALCVNVYALGAVFLQLCEVLRLSEHPIIQKLVDPSLFFPRFTDLLLEKSKNSGQARKAISNTALRIMASMKRDWMQTGRKPSGLCGAALYIAALSHGLDFSKSDIVNVVRVCEETLTKRLIEFENTESGSLTIDEFISRSEEITDELQFDNLPKAGTLLCEYKNDNGASHFAGGLCSKCYAEFVKISGGVGGGADPPAFQRAERQRQQAAEKKENAKHACPDSQNGEGNLGSKHDRNTKTSRCAVDGSGAKEPALNENTGSEGHDELSDIDDAEVASYINKPHEVEFKKIIWEEMNRDYLEEQALKEVLASLNDSKGPDNAKKERKRRRTEKTEPAETPYEATCNILKQKGFGKKVNMEALGELYTTSTDVGSKNDDDDGEFVASGDGKVDDFW